jgi:probable HAF family extracellular repeat protein
MSDKRFPGPGSSLRDASGIGIDEGKVMRGMLRVAGAVLVGLTASLLAPSGASAAAEGPAGSTYTYVEVTPFGAPPRVVPYSLASDVNNAGQVTGVSTIEEDGCAIHSFVTSDGSRLTDLGTLEPRRKGREKKQQTCYGTFADAINNVGDIVGNAHVADFEPPHAFLYRNGVLQDLGTGLGSGSYSFANDINDAGLIVGARGSSQGDPEHAVAWHNGALTPLPGLGGKAPAYEIQDRAEAVNSAGDVVGTARATDGVLHAALWRGGQIQDLGAQFPNATATFARDVNDAGQVAIEFFGREGMRAQVWQDGTIRQIGDFDPSGINASGQVVGTQLVKDATGATFRHAVVWRDGAVVDLNQATPNLPSGVTLGFGEEINDSGVIVGSTCDNQCALLGSYRDRGFLLIPNS